MPKKRDEKCAGKCTKKSSQKGTEKSTGKGAYTCAEKVHRMDHRKVLQMLWHTQYICIYKRGIGCFIKTNLVVKAGGDVGRHIADL